MAFSGGIGALRFIYREDERGLYLPGCFFSGNGGMLVLFLYIREMGGVFIRPAVSFQPMGMPVLLFKYRKMREPFICLAASAFRHLYWRPQKLSITTLLVFLSRQWRMPKTDCPCRSLTRPQCTYRQTSSGTG